MNFQDIPIIFEILEREHLKPISSNIEGDKVVCEDASGNKYVMKDCRGTEKQVFEQVFPVIKKQNLSFKKLQLPEYLRVVSQPTTGSPNPRDFIFINHYNGITFNNDWNETSPLGYGGRNINIGMAEKTVDLLEDFSLIDIAQLQSFNLLTFDFTNWKARNFPLKAQMLIGNNFLTQTHINKASSILASNTLFENSKMILTNGDFYPRNFIELPTGKIVVIDWEGREDYQGKIIIDGVEHIFTSQRNTLINYPENHAAFFFVHMWGNYGVQKDFVRKVSQRFNLNAKNLQAGIIMKSLEQAYAFGGAYLTVRQAEIFVNALELGFVQDLMK